MQGAGEAGRFNFQRGRSTSTFSSVSFWVQGRALGLGQAKFSKIQTDQVQLFEFFCFRKKKQTQDFPSLKIKFAFVARAAVLL